MVEVLQVSGNADAGETFQHSVSFTWCWKSLEDTGEQLLFTIGAVYQNCGLVLWLSLSELHSSKGKVLMPLNMTQGTHKLKASMRKSCVSTCVPSGQERSSKGWGQSMT